MTLQELAADQTFDRYFIPVPPSLDWLKIASGIVRLTLPELSKLTPSEREAVTIGLRSLDHQDARDAVTMLDR